MLQIVAYREEVPLRIGPRSTVYPERVNGESPSLRPLDQHRGYCNTSRPGAASRSGDPLPILTVCSAQSASPEAVPNVDSKRNQGVIKPRYPC